jgi:hypothetical protein
MVGWLYSFGHGEAEHHGRRMWERKTAHLLVAEKQRSNRKVPGVTGKMALKITLVLVSHRRKIQASHKDSVKVIVKFIRKGYAFNRLKTGCL